MPPFSASTTAHTRLGFAPETVTPIRPKTVSGSPCALISFQVVPPSAERYRPLPGPPLSMLQGVRRACQRAANRILELLGSKVMSIAPVLASLYKTFSQVFRVDDQSTDGTRVAKPDKLPGLARVDRFVYSVSAYDVAADARYPGADIN